MHVDYIHTYTGRCLQSVGRKGRILDSRLSLSTRPWILLHQHSPSLTDTGNTSTRTYAITTTANVIVPLLILHLDPFTSTYFVLWHLTFQTVISKFIFYFYTFLIVFIILYLTICSSLRMIQRGFKHMLYKNIFYISKNNKHDIKGDFYLRGFLPLGLVTVPKSYSLHGNHRLICKLFMVSFWKVLKKAVIRSKNGLIG